MQEDIKKVQIYFKNDKVNLFVSNDILFLMKLGHFKLKDLILFNIEESAYKSEFAQLKESSKN